MKKPKFGEKIIEQLAEPLVEIEIKGNEGRFQLKLRQLKFATKLSIYDSVSKLSENSSLNLHNRHW